MSKSARLIVDQYENFTATHLEIQIATSIEHLQAAHLKIHAIV
jgi:hypothetical protein